MGSWRAFSAFLAALVVVTATGCEGGSTAAPTGPSSKIGVGGFISVGGTGNQTTLVHPSGYSAAVAFPATSDGSSGTIQATITTDLPTGVLTPQSSALRRAPTTIGAPLSPLVYVLVTPSTNLTFTNTPSFSFGVSSSAGLTPASFVYVAFFDPAVAATNGWVTVLGPGTIAGQTLTFPSKSGKFALTGGTTYLFALLVTQRPVSVYSTDASAPKFVVSPTSLTLQGVGQSYAGTFTVSESNNSVPILGSFAFAPSACAPYIFQNSPPASVTNAITFTVWPPLPVIGTCTFTMSDQTSGGTIAVPITLPSAGPISVGGS